MTQITRQEQVTILGMPYSLIIFRHSDNNSESLFEEEPTELYFKTIMEAWAVFEKYYEAPGESGFMKALHFANGVLASIYTIDAAILSAATGVAAGAAIAGPASAATKKPAAKKPAAKKD